ncbi:UDP-2,4-diacetamido-2,4,6-trideoxy-beta-L-altropyranose hydrolase [Magnetovibrio sp.]|uniref:UDP-2,4-diacetamido-2,4, 6-trideoxy-beta-L-altropyranose hydrolase n=1 Tax=Magnetovibrio sp. TaxID=2024836 RepID=UPI002F93C19D
MTKSETLTAIFRCDAGPRLGGGHVIRCLTLAHALKQEGWNIRFAVSPQTLDIVPQLAQSDMTYVEVDKTPDAFMAPFQNGCHLAVIDHYEWNGEHHRRCKGWAQRILVIDDMANRSYEADFLLDQTIGRAPQEYIGKVPSACRVMTGANYALLRPEFAENRQTAITYHTTPRDKRKILISMGMMDADDLTSTALRGLAQLTADIEVDVVLSKRAPNIDKVRSLSLPNHIRMTIHADGGDMAQLMSAADISIGASGVTSLERCSLGLPSVTVVLADNQARIAEEVAEAGASINLGWHGDVTPGDIAEAVRRLMSDEPLYLHMVDKAAGLCDGTGTARTIQTILSGFAQ